MHISPTGLYAADMNLSAMLEGLSATKMFQTAYGKMVVTHDVQVNGIQYDSRKVGPENVFVAIRGSAADGHSFIDRAIERGAKVVIMEEDAALSDSFFMHAGVVKVVVHDSRKALAIVSANYYGHPSRRLKLIGVTGTNGKTTTTYLIRSILESTGERVGVIGTVGYMIGNETLPATHTTPESPELHQLLATMVQRGCTAAVLEVSSHSLVLHRVHSLGFHVGVFTNLTQDHLDFHGSMEEYFRAKKILFDHLSTTSTAVTNTDDPYGKQIVAATQAAIVTYGVGSPAMITATGVDLRLDGTRLSITRDSAQYHVESSLIGGFNVQNILAAYATGVALGIPDDRIIAGIARVKGVRGRFERIVSPAGWTAVVDYAHTPDALENCLRTIHTMFPKPRTSKIITIFGCGGNRDRGKRPIMGRIASELSDLVIITSDNPRHENPQAIIDDVVGGVVKGKSVHTEVDRRKAVSEGLRRAERGDIVLIAGKGHENYQVIGETKVHLDDREEVEAFIRNMQ